MSSATLDLDPATPPPSPVSGPARHSPAAVGPAGVVTIAAASAGLLSCLPGLPHAVDLLLVVAFVLVAPGNALLIWWRGLSPHATWALPPLLGIAIVVLATAVEAFAKAWHPSASLVGLAVASVVSVAVHSVLGRTGRLSAGLHAAAVGTSATVADDLGEDEPSTWAWSRAVAPLIAIGVALVVWALALPTVGTSDPSPWGLLAGSPAIAAALVVVVVAGVLALRRRSATGMLAATVAVILIERLTVSLATAVPFYPWTYKHLGVVDFIDRFHYVVRGTDVYHNWPGAFTAVAWVGEQTGVAPMSIAHWFTPVYHLGLVAAVYAAARAWRLSPFVAATTVFVFEVASCIGQDYFSPQAFAYLLGIGVLLVLGESSRRRVAAVPAIILFTAVTITHQLTPYWLLLVVGALVVLRRTKPWWLVPVFASIAGGYLLLNYSTISRYATVASGDPLQNVRLAGRAQPVLGIRTAFWATEFLYVVLFGAALLVTAVALFRRREWRTPGVLGLSPVLLLLVQGYGGEAIFRVFLYALPALAAIAASLAVRSVTGPRWTGLATALMVGTVTMASAHVYLGSFYSYRVDRSEIAVWDSYNREAAIPSYLYALSVGYPGNPEWYYVPRVTRDVFYVDTVYGGGSPVPYDFSNSSDYTEFMSIVTGVRSTTSRPVYLVLSDAQQVYAQYNGVLPPDATAELRGRISVDSRWRLVDDAGGSQLYELLGS